MQLIQVLNEKRKTNIGPKEEGTTYCLGCRDYTHNIGSKKVTMTNKVIKEKSRCADCVPKKSRF